jgi:very-short-patch-repair endonuclease
MQQTDQSTAVARAQRRALPVAERILWQALRNRRFLGLKVRRQVPLCGTVVDFYCPDRCLAIDLCPASPARDGRLSARGFTVLRLDRQAVVADLPASLARIAAACRQRIDPLGPI